MKKLSTLLLSGALVLSAAVPAFAEGGSITAPVVVDGAAIESVEGGATGQDVTSEAAFTLPTIKVTLPTSHGFIVNPYNLENKGQIVSAEATIKNESSVAVEVSLKSTSADIDGAGDDTKKYATLGPVTDKTTSKTVQLDLKVTADADKGTVYPTNGLVNITGKNTNVKLVNLVAETGVAQLKYEGKAVANPVGNPWTDADDITVTSTYVFTPVVNPATP